MTEPVTIAMCTFRRMSAFDALRSFERLEGIDRSTVQVVVVDNDDTDAMREEFRQFAARYPFPLHYVHAPAGNISIARNAALDAAQTRWLAFIDDDETADPQWLAKLLECRASSVAIIGQCQATYDTALPGWLSRCDFHSNRITGNVVNAYTSNALLDLDFVRRHRLRFRPELGRTGGEDTIFFRQIAELGGAIHYCPQALVYEPVPPGRANMKWVLRRKYRAGQTHGLLCREFDRPTFRKLWLSAGAKLAYSACMTVLAIPGSDRWRRWLARAALHAGAVSYRLKPALIEEYAPPVAAQ